MANKTVRAQDLANIEFELVDVGGGKWALGVSQVSGGSAGTVALDAATLTALENTTAAQGIAGASASVSAAIPAGATGISAAIDLGAGQTLARIIVPNGWIAAGLSFQSSPDNVTFYNLYIAPDSNGTAPNEYKIGVPVTTGCSVIVPLADFASIRYLKVRSGTIAAPVNQTGAPTLTLITRPVF